MTMQASQVSSALPTLIQDDAEAAKKLEDFLSSLPKESGWNMNLYNYQSHWFPADLLPGIIPCQTNFQAQHSDIFLVTYPKSGTTWLKAIVFAISNRAEFCVTSTQHPLRIRNPHDLIPFIEFGRNENRDLYCLKNPRLFATHLPYGLLPQSVKDYACKIVYLSRNPKDTFISEWHFLNKFTGQTQYMENNSLKEGFELFCKGRSFYGPYWNHVLGYWEKSLEMNDNLFFFKYEDLKKEPFLFMKKIAEFLGFPFSIEEEASGVIDEIVRLCSFENLSNLDVNKNGRLSNMTWMEKKMYFRRGEIGDWKNFLTEEMISKIDGITEENFKACGLEF